MTPSTNGTKTVQLTVFDLTKFDSVTLKKEVSVPSRPESLEAALAACGNDKDKLLSMIHEGMVADAVETARNDVSGFREVTEDGELGEVYTGKFADEAATDKINAIVLAIAKANGYDKSLDKDAKRKVKENARDFIRQNPAMIAGITASGS